MDKSKEFSLMLVNACIQHPDDFHGFDKNKNVQDQLQEMIKNKVAVSIPDLCDTILAFALEVKAHLTSMEQLWLAFVMKEKYNKIWTESEWIKCPH